MLLPHDVAARSLCQNFRVAKRMYERGWFEYSVSRNQDGLLEMPRHDPTLFSHVSGNSSRSDELLVAVSELRDQALLLLPELAELRSFADEELFRSEEEKLWPSLSGFENLVKVIYRVQVIHYELKDALLRITRSEAESFRGYPRSILEETGQDQDSTRVNHNIRRMFRKDTHIQLDAALSLSVTDEFLLLGLCGINAFYRQHSSESYSEGLALLRGLEDYIKDERRKRKNRESLGLLGLTAYLRGRLELALSRYVEARDAWIRSCEYYTRKIEQKRPSLTDGDKRREEKWEDARLLCLRRSALAAAMGNGYLLFLLSKLNACLEVVALSRAVLTKSCSRVYVAYVDLIYAAAKRAKHSSNIEVLKECEERLEGCLSIFENLVRGSHYVERAKIELAIVFHYQARILSRANERESKPKTDHDAQIKLLYEEALKNLNSAIDYADAQGDPTRRNPRMLAEAYAIRSHIWRHRPQDHYEQATNPRWEAAVHDAQEALKYVGEMSLLECEARIALGAAYLSIAEGLRSEKILVHEVSDTKKASQTKYDPKPGEKEDQIWKYKRLADEQLSLALNINAKANPRISAVCFLRLAQAGLLMETTLPDVRFFLDQFQKVSDRVEHAFCHELALDISEQLQRKGAAFFVDVRQRGLNIAFWEDELKDYLSREAVNRIVDNMSHPLPGDTDKSLKRRGRGRKTTLKGQFIRDLVSHTGYSPEWAKVVADKYLTEFFNKLKATGKYVGDDD